MQGLTHARPSLPKGRDLPGRQIVTPGVCVHGNSMMQNRSAVVPSEPFSDGYAGVACKQASESTVAKGCCCHAEA